LTQSNASSSSIRTSHPRQRSNAPRHRPIPWAGRKGNRVDIGALADGYLDEYPAENKPGCVYTLGNEDDDGDDEDEDGHSVSSDEESGREDDQKGKGRADDEEEDEDERKDDGEMNEEERDLQQGHEDGESEREKQDLAEAIRRSKYQVQHQNDDDDEEGQPHAGPSMSREDEQIRKYGMVLPAEDPFPNDVPDSRV
jgi:hypothetical protein